jgi:hypothetical protein
MEGMGKEYGGREEGSKEGDKGAKGIGKWKNKCEGTVLR